MPLYLLTHQTASDASPPASPLLSDAHTRALVALNHIHWLYLTAPDGGVGFTKVPNISGKVIRDLVELGHARILRSPHRSGGAKRVEITPLGRAVVNLLS